MKGKPTRSHPAAKYVMCINAGDYRVDLRFGRVYVVAKRDARDREEMIRIYDESGEDYLYPRDWFVPVEVPPKGRKALVAAVA